MEQYSFFRVIVTSLVSLAFVKNSFSCQEKLVHLQKEMLNFLPLHPFNPPLCTRAGYAYKLLCYFSPKMKLLRVIKQPIAMQSSAGEIEFCSFMKWQNPLKCIEFAWSPKGQKRSAEAVPDMILENTCFFWNGCAIHGHKPENCLFNQKTGNRKRKTLFGLDAEEAYNMFQNKKARLMANHNVQTEVIWQCAWERQKKTDPSVQYFLKYVYRFPPLYRLDPRAAGIAFFMISTKLHFMSF